METPEILPSEIGPRRPPVPAHPLWSRGLVASAVGLTILQGAVFAWLARIPEPLNVPMRSSPPVRPAVSARLGGGAMILAIDGLREEQNWLPNPRPMISSPPRSSLARTARPALMELTPPGKPRSQQFLPSVAAPAPSAPVIPRPETGPTDLTTPRPESPPTQVLALTHSEVSFAGALLNRAQVRPIALAPWKGPESLGVSRVEVSINPDGEVVLARVVESCGVKAADLQFLAACRAIRFAPLSKIPAGPSSEQLQHGRIVVRWAAPP